MKSPVMDEFPYDTIKSEAGVREDYLVNHYLPAVREQEKGSIFSEIIQLLYLRKVGAFGKGRSGGAARDFIRMMKTRANYTGRTFNGEVRPMCYHLDDPSVTAFPPGMSTIVLISGGGKTESVVQKSRACVEYNIDSIAFSYEPQSLVAKCAKVYHQIPRKINSENARGTVDVLGNSFETGAHISGSGVVDGLVEYHNSEDMRSASKRCLRSIENSVKYIQYLNRSLDISKEGLIELGKMLAVARNVRLAAAGDNAASLQMGMNRLAHTGRDGFESSIDFISSDNFGPPGYSDIEEGDGVIISSSTFQSSHTIAIGIEATKSNAKLCLITSDRLTDDLLTKRLKKYKIKKPDILLRIPFSLPDDNERHFDIGVRHVSEYIAAAEFEYLGKTKRDVEATHLQKGLE